MFRGWERGQARIILAIVLFGFAMLSAGAWYGERRASRRGAGLLQVSGPARALPPGALSAAGALRPARGAALAGGGLSPTANSSSGAEMAAPWRFVGAVMEPCLCEPRARPPRRARSC